MAGALGSYGLVGVLVGALLAGTVGDTIGCRKVMLAAYAWFAMGIPVTALTSAVSMFGLLRFLTRDHIMASLSINRGIGQDWPFAQCDHCQSMRRFRRLLAHARW